MPPVLYGRLLKNSAPLEIKKESIRNKIIGQAILIKFAYLFMPIFLPVKYFSIPRYIITNIKKSQSKKWDNTPIYFSTKIYFLRDGFTSTYPAVTKNAKRQA